ncbi:SulP family inorganic anion transporter [Salsipaludibacter albus]|uniref:SulP family inorganic anion transporter n=1 Tax=Salsipaludibacter albus TaxID=2849650 RepID=UPI001EE496D1
MGRSRQSSHSGWLARHVPILAWLPAYRPEWFRHDLVAGVAVAALVVPKSLGYAEIAAVPIQHGLYAAVAGTLLYAVFGTSRQISTGPSSALATVAGGAVLLSGMTGPDAVSLVATITAVSGVLFLLLALFRMGWISQFLSRAVITGFLFGAAIDVVVGELPKVTGTQVDGGSTWQEAGQWLASLASTDPTTVVVGLASLALILGLRFTDSRLPGALVVVVAGLVASTVLDFEARGVALVGDVPRGFAAPVLPSLSLLVEQAQLVGAAAVGLLLIGFSQTAGDAREFASRHGYRVDIDQEATAQGMANAASGVLQGIPVATSLSASSLNDQSGARTPMASLVTGGLVVLTLVFLAPVFSALPKPVLAAVIIDAVVFGMMNLPELRRLFRVARADFWIALAAILGVLATGVLAGVLIGVALSVAWLVHVSTNPAMPLLGRQAGTQVFRSLEEYPDGSTYPGVVVLAFDAGLHFASAAALEDRVREVVDQAGEHVHTIVLDFEGVNFIDSQGASTLGEIVDFAEEYGASVRLARVKQQVRALLERDGLVERLGDGELYGNIYEAAADHVARHDGD